MGVTAARTRTPAHPRSSRLRSELAPTPTSALQLRPVRATVPLREDEQQCARHRGVPDRLRRPWLPHAHLYRAGVWDRGDTEHRSARSRLRSASASEALTGHGRPGSALLPSGSAGLPGRRASGPRGSGCSVGPGLGGKDPEGSAGHPFPPPCPAPASGWLAHTDHDLEAVTLREWGGLCDPRTHRDAKLPPPTHPLRLPCPIANLTSRIRGRSWKVLSEHPLRGACDLKGLPPTPESCAWKMLPGAELSGAATD